MKPTIGRPAEKQDAKKITLYLEQRVIDILQEVATENRFSRSKAIEKLALESHQSAVLQDKPNSVPNPSSGNSSGKALTYLKSKPRKRKMPQ